MKLNSILLLRWNIVFNKFNKRIPLKKVFYDMYWTIEISNFNLFFSRILNFLWIRFFKRIKIALQTFNSSAYRFFYTSLKQIYNRYNFKISKFFTLKMSITLINNVIIYNVAIIRKFIKVPNLFCKKWRSIVFEKF